MGTLVLVRHGQASLHAEDYDQLSDLGGEQSQALGNYWRDMGQAWNRVFVGPRKRHLQTANLAAKSHLDSRGCYSKITTHDAFDEHQGAWVVKSVLEKTNPSVTKNFVPQDALKDPETKKLFMKRFRDITLAWAKGDIPSPGIESWQAFTQRIKHGMHEIRSQISKGEKAVVFSSAGPLAVATGQCLGLDDKGILELKWQIRNSAMAEFRVTSKGLALVSFNAVPHVRCPSLLTLV